MHTFSGLTILDPLGNDVTPEKLKIAQQNQISTDDLTKLDSWLKSVIR
nr:hypothetical protein [Brevibacillus brevis]